MGYQPGLNEHAIACFSPRFRVLVTLVYYEKNDKNYSGSIHIDNKKSFAIKRVRQTATLRDIEVLEIKEITIDGLGGYEITARGTDKNHGGACYFYQAILYGETDYYMIVGIVAAAENSDYLPTFQQIAMTFKKK